ncbi:MAG TPA: hypothetical protein VJ506_00150 [Candidatus Limnocylindrales bacterium]|nr:hypothetical protein [Candidatus Limnocylindrales bacterium]
MAVYQGARQRRGFAFALPANLRPGLLPWGAGERAGGRTGRHQRTDTGATPRAHGRRNAGVRVGIRRATTQQVGLVLAGIVVAFSGAFLWLSQSVRVTATNYDIVRLTSEHDRLEALSVDIRSDLSRLSGTPAIRQEALDLGYGQLGAPQVIQAH